MKKTASFAVALFLAPLIMASTAAQAHKVHGHHHHKHHVVVVKPKPRRNTVVIHHRPHRHYRPARPGRALTHAVADAIWWNATH